MTQPSISVITPSFNQGQFLEDTIQSVIGQNYKNLEYIIMDGGSSDNSVEIIKKYEKHLTYWVSEKDGGQGSAINAGFQKATGDILCWLNSDDMYLPNTLNYVARSTDINQAELIFGNCLHLLEGDVYVRGSDVRKNHEKLDLKLCDYVIQPSSFWTRKAWLNTGELDENLNYGFDWEWFLRAQKASVKFKPQTRYLSIYRLHTDHKSGVGGNRRIRELALIYGRYAGKAYEELFQESYCCRSKISFVRKWIARLRLSRYETPILKIAFPTLFSRFSGGEIENVLKMI